MIIPGLINILKPRLSWLVGIISLVFMELIIWRLTSWPWLTLIWLGLLWLLAGVRQLTYGVKGFYRVAALTALTGLGTVFFIDIVIWQHLFSGLVSALLGWLFYSVAKLQRHKTLPVGALWLPYSYTFFAAALALGVKIFFQSTFVASLSLLLALIMLYPTGLVLYSKKSFRPSLPLPGLRQGKKKYNLWRSNWRKNDFFSRSFAVTPLPWFKQIFLPLDYLKFFLLFIMAQVFGAVLSLPTGVLVGASLVTIITHGIFSLLDVGQVTPLRRGLVFRNMGLGLFLISVILLSARWT